MQQLDMSPFSRPPFSRLRYVPVLPPTQRSLAYWTRRLQREGMRGYALTATGTAFTASRSLLRLRTWSLAELRDIARRYWTGIVVPDAEDAEVLFAGDAVVASIVPSPTTPPGTG